MKKYKLHTLLLSVCLLLFITASDIACAAELTAALDAPAAPDAASAEDENAVLSEDELARFNENQNAVASAGADSEVVTLAALTGTAVASSSANPPTNATLVIDISEWQVRDQYEPSKDQLIDFNVIDYDLISEQVDAVILRVGYTGWGTGQSYYQDVAFERFYREFSLRGVPMGAYWYSCADTVAEGVAEAKMALKFINGRRFALPVYWDTEDTYHQAKVSPKQLTDTGIAFMDTIRAAGYQTGLYSSTYWLNTRLETARLANYNLWLAHWNISWPTYTGGHYSMWQYSSKGRLAGYDRDLDMNYKLTRTFTDVSASQWFYVHTENLAHAGIIQGYAQKNGTQVFRHQDNLTRAQAAKMIVMAAGLSHVGKVSSFSDVPASHWASGFIAAGQERGIIHGYNDGTFRPEDPVSRAEITKMVTEAMNLSSVSVLAAGGSFTDVNTEDWAWARPYIQTLSSLGIISGYGDGTFKPGRNVTRAEFTKMLTLAMEVVTGS